jgi:RNA polymerase sigma-70 factor (ECF subfamily)
VTNHSNIQVSQHEFLQLLAQHQNIIYKLVNLYATDAEGKKDMYQEIVLQAWKSFSTYAGRSRFSTWLYRLSLNTIFTLKRKPFPIDLEEDLASYETVAVPTANHENKHHLLQVIRRLNEIDRAIISLHLDGYDNSEIAGILGISTNNVNVKLFRAKQKVVKLFNKA